MKSLFKSILFIWIGFCMLGYAYGDDGESGESDLQKIEDKIMNIKRTGLKKLLESRVADKPCELSNVSYSNQEKCLEIALEDGRVVDEKELVTNFINKKCTGSTGSIEVAELAKELGPCNSLRKAIENNNKDIEEDDKWFAESMVDKRNGNPDIYKLKCGAEPLKEPDGPLTLTLDFRTCVSAVKGYDLFSNINLGANLAGNIYNNYKVIKDDKEINKESESVQEKSYSRLSSRLESDRSKALQDAATYGAFAASLTKSASNIPIYKDLYSACVDGNNDGVTNHIIPEMTTLMACDLATYYKKNPNNSFFLNTVTKGQLKEKGVKALAQSVSAGLKAEMLRSAKDSTEKVKQAFKDATFDNGQTQIAAGATFCQNNPTAPSCRQAQGKGAVSGGIDFQFGNIGGQTGSLELENDEFSTDSDNIVGESDSGIAAADIDDLSNINGSSARSNKEFNQVAGAKLKKGSPGASGGGGGAAAAGGGGAAAGSGGSGDSKAQADKGYGDIIKSKYTRGSSGNFTRGKSVAKKKSESSNAFNSLFKANRKIASDDKELLPKKIGLFDAITKRYKVENQKQGFSQ